MKTPQIVNDPLATQLMEVTAELSVAHELFEKHIIDHASKRIEVCAKTCYEDVIDHLGDIAQDRWAGIRDIIIRGIIDVAIEANTFNGIQERSKGIEGQYTPSSVTDRAIREAKSALAEWSKVST